MRNVFRSGSIGLALAIGGLVLGACTTPALTVEEYADALGAATDDYIEESQALSASFQRTVEAEIKELAASGEENVLSLATGATIRETVQFLALLEDAMARYGQKLDEMEPPAELADVHDEYVASIESVRVSLPATRTNVGDAQDLDQIEEAITSSGFSDGQLRLRSSCTALESAVRAEGQSAELGCTRPVGTG